MVSRSILIIRIQWLAIIDKSPVFHPPIAHRCINTTLTANTLAAHPKSPLSCAAPPVTTSGPEGVGSMGISGEGVPGTGTGAGPSGADTAPVGAGMVSSATSPGAVDELG